MRQRSKYDVMGRVWKTQATGPATTIVRLGETDNGVGTTVNSKCACTRVWILLVSVSHLGACQNGRSQLGASGSAEPCPQVPAPTYSTQVIRAQFTPMQLRLPTGAFRSQDFVDELEYSQAWVDSSGLLVSYTVQTEPPVLRNISSGDRDVVNCSEMMGVPQ